MCCRNFAGKYSSPDRRYQKLPHFSDDTSHNWQYADRNNLVSYQVFFGDYSCIRHRVQFCVEQLHLFAYM